MATEEELRRLLAQKDAEFAELQAQLAKAATLGQELIAQNEGLKTQLLQDPAVASGSRGTLSGTLGGTLLTGSGDVIVRQRLSVPLHPAERSASDGTSASASSARRDVNLNFEDLSDGGSGSERLGRSRAASGASDRSVPLGKKLSTSTAPFGSRAMAPRSRLGTWEDWRAEQSHLEEEHALLKRRCAKLESELHEQTANLSRGRAGSDFTRSRASSIAAAALPSLPERARLANDLPDQEEKEEQRLAVQRLQEAQGQFQEHVDELQARCQETESRNEMLKAQLEAQTAQLQEEAERYGMMVKEMEHRQLQDARTIHDHEKDKELELRRKTAINMQDSLAEFSRRPSASLMMGPMKSIFDEVQIHPVLDTDQNLDQLEQENEELLKAVLELRAQLDQAEKHMEAMQKDDAFATWEEQGLESEPAEPLSGGDAAAGGGGEAAAASMTAAQQATAEAVASQLEGVRQGLEESTSRLQRQRKSLTASQMLRGVPVVEPQDWPRETPADAREPPRAASLWDMFKIMSCCSTKELKVEKRRASFAPSV